MVKNSGLFLRLRTVSAKLHDARQQFLLYAALHLEKEDDNAAKMKAATNIRYAEAMSEGLRQLDIVQDSILENLGGSKHD